MLTVQKASVVIKNSNKDRNLSSPQEESQPISTSRSSKPLLLDSQEISLSNYLI